MRITVEKVKKPKKKEGIWIKPKGEEIWFYLPQAKTVFSGEEYNVEADLRTTRDNRKYYLVKKIEQVRQAEQKQKEEAGTEKTISLQEAVKELEKVEKAINNVVIGREEMVRLSLITAVSGGNMLMVGGTGIGKTMTAELVASAFSDRVLYNQLNHYKELTNIIGNIDLKKFRETGEVEYRTDRFLNADFHIYDEFFHSKGKLRGALNDYILRRSLTIDDRGVLKGKTRAIFLTSNRLEDLQDPKVQAEGGLAIADRIHIILQVPDPDETVLEKLLMGGGTKKEYSFRQPLSSVEVLERIRQEAEKIPTPKWLVKKIAEFDAAMKLKLAEEYRISPRKYIALVEMMKVSAVLDGRNAITLKDARRILPNAVFTLDQQVKEELKDVLNISTEHLSILLEKIRNGNPKEIAETVMAILGEDATLVDVKEMLKGDGIEQLYVKETVPDWEKVIEEADRKLRSLNAKDIENFVDEEVRKIEEEVVNADIDKSLKP